MQNFLILILISQVIGFLVEPWYYNLHHFGPTRAEGWENRPMELIDDYTYFLSDLTVDADQMYMFVPIIEVAVPPLGNQNWKQGKIGLGVNGNLMPGGDGGRYPNSATYNITLYTAGHPTRSNQIDLTPLPNTVRPNSLIEGSASENVGETVGDYIVDANLATKIQVAVSFSEQVQPILNASSVISAVNGHVQSNIVNLGMINGRHVFNFTVIPIQEGQVKVTIQDAATTAIAAPHLATTSDSFTFLYTSLLAYGSSFGPLHTLRDPSDRFPDWLGDKPAGGWYVTPIHFNHHVETGQVVVTGWLRRDSMPCAGGAHSGGRRRAGITFIIDPFTEISTSTSGDINVNRIEENSEFPMEWKSTHSLTQDGHQLDGDVIYCAGHTTLQDGRKFYVGGARYSNISSAYEREWGLDYARIWDPSTGNFTSVLNHRMPLGRSWYPTAGRLPDNRILVTGGFSDYATDQCVGRDCTNPQINIFDVAEWDAGNNPWTVLIDEDHAEHDIDPGIREYTRVFILPTPVVRDGYERHVLLMGAAGQIWLINTDENTPMDHRMYKPTNGKRPSLCGEASDQSTAVHLYTNGGELMVMGGCYDSTLQSLDIYNVLNDEWETIATGIRRGVPAGLLLADGTVLIVSGENTELKQLELLERGVDGEIDPRYPQIFDPETRTITTVPVKDPAFRGYHNTASLLKDGSVLIGGGFNAHGDVGCENDNLLIFYPSYLSTASASTRPSIFNASRYDHEPFVVESGHEGLVIQLANPAGIELHATKGVALLATQALTHSYGQNQRYVRLTITDQTIDSVTVTVPHSPEAMPGQYNLFLLSADGVPSHAVWAKIELGSSPAGGNNDDGKNHFSKGIQALAAILTLGLAFGLTLVLYHYCRPRIKERDVRSEESFPYSATELRESRSSQLVPGDMIRSDA